MVNENICCSEPVRKIQTNTVDLCSGQKKKKTNEQNHSYKIPVFET